MLGSSFPPFDPLTNVDDNDPGAPNEGTHGVPSPLPRSGVRRQRIPAPRPNPDPDDTI